jgi:hypothetical protein
MAVEGREVWVDEGTSATVLVASHNCFSIPETTANSVLFVKATLLLSSEARKSMNTRKGYNDSGLIGAVKSRCQPL